MSDLWTIASIDAEAEAESRKLSMARVATAQYWPILAQATSQRGFDHACALITENVTRAISHIADSPADHAVLANKVLESYRDDWMQVSAASMSPETQGSSQVSVKPSRMTCPTCKSQNVGVVAAGNKNSEGVAPWNLPYNCRNCGSSWKIDGPAHAKDGFNPTAAWKSDSKDGNWKHDGDSHDDSVGTKVKDEQKRVDDDDHPKDKQEEFDKKQEQQRLRDERWDSSHRASQNKWDRDREAQAEDDNSALERVEDDDNPKDKKERFDKNQEEDRYRKDLKNLKGREHTALITDAPGYTSQTVWGTEADQTTDYTPQLQQQIDAWERTNHDTRVNMGNGIGVADASEGPYVAGPGANNGENPSVTGISGDEDLETADPKDIVRGYYVGKFGSIEVVGNKFIKHNPSGAPGKQWEITQKGTGKVLSRHPSEEEAQKSFEAMEAHKHGSLIFMADDDDEVSEVEDMQREGSNKKTGSIHVQAIRAAQDMVDAMPAEASVPAVKKEMQRRAKVYKLSPEDTELVVSAAVAHAYARGRRPLDKESANTSPLLKTCPICGEEIPASELEVHMAKRHPHEVKRASIKEARDMWQAPGVTMFGPRPSDEKQIWSIECKHCDKNISSSDKSEARKIFDEHHHDKVFSEAAKYADLGTGNDTFSPNTSSDTSMNEGAGGTGASVDMTGNDPGGNFDPSNLQGESVGGSGASALMNDQTVAKTTRPRQKPAHNPNAPKQQPSIGVPVAQQMVNNQMTAAKVKEMVDGILTTNPGMSRVAAVQLAHETLSRYPSMLKTARGGYDWPVESDDITYSTCPQCQVPGFDPRINVCHNCGYIGLKGSAPFTPSAFDPISGETTVHPGPRQLRNPGTK